MDCYYDWQEDFVAEGSIKGRTPAGWNSAAQSDFEKLQSYNKSMDFISLLESSWNCTGMCKSSLFPFSLPARTNITEGTCASNLGDGLKKRGPMVFNWLLAGAVITGAAWLSQFCLWFSFNEKKAPVYEMV